MESTESSVDPAVRDAWDRYLDDASSSPNGPSVSTLVGLADAEGERQKARLLPAIAAHCETPAVQQAWADWGDVTDREELRLRLEVLRHLDTLDPSLHEFLLFFFRASDPVLYQSAARALGRHLGSHPDLEAYVQQFAEKHSIRLDAPIPLDGERSHRRLLIAQAAHRAAGAAETPVLATDDPDRYFDETPLDLNAVLVATRVLLEGETITSADRAFAERLLHGVAERPVGSSADPGFIESWGRLLAALDEPSPSQTAELWTRLLRRVCVVPEDAPEDSFSAQLQRLARIDELVRRTVWLSTERQEAVLQSLHERSDEPLRQLLLYRWHLWTQREGGEPLVDGSSLPLPDEASAPILRDLIRAEQTEGADASLFGEGEVDDHRLSAFLTLLDSMAERTAWLRRPVEQRAFIAFTALDFSRHLPLPAPSVTATLDHLDFPGLRETADSSQDVPRRGRAGPETFRILLRLSAWEEAGTERLVGARLLHQVTDSYVLMMLLPSGQASELTDTLADALEHQLRLLLRTNPDFRPAHFLYETSVRAPHPQFYEYLQHLCENRTYLDTRGQEVPVAAIVTRLLTEARSLHDGATSFPGSTDESAWPGDPPFAEGLRYIRTVLTAVREAPDWIDGLERFVNVLDPKNKDPATGARRVFGVLGSIGGAAVPLVHRDQAAEGPRTYQGVREALHEHVLSLREALEHLQPATLDDVHDIRDEVLEIEETLTTLEVQIVPVVGVVEGTLLTDGLRHLRARLQSWTDALTTLYALWHTAQNGDAARPEPMDRLFDEVLAHDEGPIRGRLFAVLARTLVSDPTPETGDLEGDADWAHDMAVLDWALAPTQLHRLSAPEQQAWTDVFTTHWHDLLTRAMESGYESRVLRLVTQEQFAPIRQHLGEKDLLREVRTWFFDRYHLPAARHVTSAFQSLSALGSLAGTTASFFMHFSRVWLALLLGAILMLDFGDAWTAMAAEGEVLSVTITFVVGVAGTFGYLFVDLRGKVRRAPEESVWRAWRSWGTRVVGFLGLCLVVTGGLTTLLWVLLSGTGAVVEGPGAVLHVVVWTGFALFVGVFFGLIAETA